MDPTVVSIIFDATRFTPDTASLWLSQRGFVAQVEPLPGGGGLVARQVGADRVVSTSIKTTAPVEGVSLTMGEVKDDSAVQILTRAGSLFAGNLGPGEVDFICSTDSVDSYGDIVVQEGISLNHYRKNPIVLFNHSSNQPIGRATKVGFDEKGSLIARFKFADPSHGQLGLLADSIYKLIKDGFINASSIGFTSVEREPIYDAQGKFKGIKFLKSIIKEISVVSVPANQDALVQARSLGISEAVLRQIVVLNQPTPARDDMQRRLSVLQRKSLHFGQLPPAQN